MAAKRVAAVISQPRCCARVPKICSNTRRMSYAFCIPTCASACYRSSCRLRRTHQTGNACVAISQPLNDARCRGIGIRLGQSGQLGEVSGRRKLHRSAAGVRAGREGLCLPCRARAAGRSLHLSASCGRRGYAMKRYHADKDVRGQAMQVPHDRGCVVRVVARCGQRRPANGAIRAVQPLPTKRAIRASGCSSRAQKSHPSASILGQSFHCSAPVPEQQSSSDVNLSPSPLWPLQRTVLAPILLRPAARSPRRPKSARSSIPKP